MIKYQTAFEIMKALLERKKLRKQDWEPEVYVTLSSENYLVDQDNDSTSIMLCDEECYVEYESWDWKIGDYFNYVHELLYSTYKVIFVNDVVCLGESTLGDGYRLFNRNDVVNVELMKYIEFL